MSVYKSLWWTCTLCFCAAPLGCLSPRACGAPVYLILLAYIFYTCTCLSTIEILAAPKCVCLQEPVVNLYMCLCAAPLGCLSPRACGAPVYLILWAYIPPRFCLQEILAAPECVCLQEPVLHLYSNYLSIRGLRCCTWICRVCKKFFSTCPAFAFKFFVLHKNYFWHVLSMQ